MEELQEADVLWPWTTDTPPPSLEDDDEESYLPPATPELDEYDAATVVDFSCEPFSGPPASSSSSSASSPQWSDSDWSSDGFFLSGPSSAGSAGVVGLDGTEEFLEADVLWPDDTADDEAEGGAPGFWWRRRCCRLVEEAAASAGGAAAAACREEREGWRPLVSSPIDIPMATRGPAAARRRRSPLSPC